MVLSIPHRAARLLIAIVATVGGAAHAAHADQPRYCEIAMEFSVNGHPVAAPSTIVEFGKEADVAVSDSRSAGGWQFRIIADEPALVRRANVIPIAIELYELVDGQPVLRASPHFNIAPGQRAEVDTNFAEDDGRRAHIGLVANIRSDAEVEALTNKVGDEPR